MKKTKITCANLKGKEKSYTIDQNGTFASSSSFSTVSNPIIATQQGAKLVGTANVGIGWHAAYV